MVKVSLVMQTLSSRHCHFDADGKGEAHFTDIVNVDDDSSCSS